MAIRFDQLTEYLLLTTSLPSSATVSINGIIERYTGK